MVLIAGDLVRLHNKTNTKNDKNGFVLKFVVSFNTQLKKTAGNNAEVCVKKE